MSVRRHFAFAVKPVAGGYEVEHVIEFPTRGQADKEMLRIVGRHGDADSITLDRELRDGEVLDAALLKRPAPPSTPSPARPQSKASAARPKPAAANPSGR